MYKQGGVASLLLTWLYYLVFALFSLRCAPNMEKLVEQRMRKEGAIRAAQQRLMTYIESVLLLHGFDTERRHLRKLFALAIEQAQVANFVLCRFSLVSLLYTRYGSIIAGYVIALLGLLCTTRQRGVMRGQRT
uniref:ABC transporter D family member 2 n=1 Tax=Lygus hesperus TaxID=30085 RepID=A0A0A9XMV8_LYGHE